MDTTDAQTNLIEALKTRGFRASLAEPDVFLQGGMADYLVLRIRRDDHTWLAPVAPGMIEDVPPDTLAEYLVGRFLRP